MKLSICSGVKFLSAGTDEHFAATVCKAIWEHKLYQWPFWAYAHVMWLPCDHLIKLHCILAALLNCPNLLLANSRHETREKVIVKLSTLHSHSQQQPATITSPATIKRITFADSPQSPWTVASLAWSSFPHAAISSAVTWAESWERLAEVTY